MLNKDIDKKETMSTKSTDIEDQRWSVWNQAQI